MHSSQLAELGSWVALNAGNLVYGEREQPMLVATSYWTASRIRVQRWVAALKMFEQDFQDTNADGVFDPNAADCHNPWPALEIVVQEILVSEVLTRVWSAAVLAHDLYHQTDEMHGLAHSVHVSHLEAKNRAFRMMLRGQAADESAFDRMNALRRRMERWTDLFLGQLPEPAQASTFAFDKNRVKDFHSDQQETAGARVATAQRILAASFSTDLLRNQIAYAANPELNQEVAAGVLACFPADRFDDRGLPKSTRMIWLEKSHRDTQMLVDHLCEFEDRADQASTANNNGNNRQSAAFRFDGR